MIRILFVCHGNICRSPMAEFILKDMTARRGIAEEFYIASAATSTEEIWHGVGNPVYPPARDELAKHGISCQGKRAVQMTRADYENYDYLDEIIQKTLETEQVEHALFSVVFVGNEEIQEINKLYRGLDKVTDVISFALEDNPDDFCMDTRVLGDIYVCIPRMKEQANTYGHSEKRELSFLVVHGLLHLLGYDHMVKEEEEVMFALQDKILEGVGIIS